MNILVTGGSGYVGSVLVPMLAKLEGVSHYVSTLEHPSRYPPQAVFDGRPAHHIRVLETMAFGNPIEGTENVEFMQGDIRDAETVKRALDSMDAVIHLAGIVTDELVDLNKDFAYSVNVKATRDLVEAAYVGSVKRFLYASSSSVYGHAAEGDAPVRENVPCLPKTSYAVQKYQAEQIVLGYAQNGFVTSAVRQATACGPAPRMRLDTVVNVFSKQAYFDGKITVHGGSQYRSNVHVQDAAEFYCLLLEAPAEDVNGQNWNVTSGNLPVREIAELVAGTFRDFQAPELIPAPPIIVQDVADARSYRLDATKARRVLGWTAKRTVADAARDNFTWFRAGKIANPNDAIYRNTDRMRETMLRG